MQQKQNTFTTYELTSQEQEEGSKLSYLQEAVIQNLISECAEEKLRLSVDPQNINAFLQAEAELAGKIGILSYLLETSKAVSTQ